MNVLSKDRTLEPLDMIVRAFDEDPFFRFLRPERESRNAFVGEVMRSNLEVGAPRGWVRIVEEDRAIVGSAVWIPPGQFPPGLATIRARAASIVRGLTGPHKPPITTIIHALRTAALMEEAHPPQPFYYLQVLAVDPDHHGRGIGSGILKSIVAEADRDKLPSALETAKPINVKLYERHGFRITRSFQISGSPPMWIMVRPPAA